MCLIVLLYFQSCCYIRSRLRDDKDDVYSTDGVFQGVSGDNELWVPTTPHQPQWRYSEVVYLMGTQLITKVDPDIMCVLVGH